MGLERHIPDVLIDRLKGDVLLGYNSDSACFEISHAFLLIVLLKFLSFVTDIISEWQGVYCSLREVVNSILGDV